MPASAAELLESYNAYLSERDHFNSSGVRLGTAAAIIRQDRANVHRFGLRDAGDEDDNYFNSEANRALLEQLLNRGRDDPRILARIVNDTVSVRVDVYRSYQGDYVVVTVLD